MRFDIAALRCAKKYSSFFLFLFVLSINVSGQRDFRTYTYWDHPVIKALDNHVPEVIGFSRPGNRLVSLCIADTSNGIAYFITQYGFIFDTLHLTGERKREIRLKGKAVDPFHWFEVSVSQYASILAEAKDFLRENGSDAKKATYVEQRVLTLPLIKAASSTLSKLLAIEEYEKEYKNVLIHFNWWINTVDASVKRRASEGRRPGSLIIHGTADSGYSEFINKEILSTVYSARLEHRTGQIFFYGWEDRPVDSFYINKNKIPALLQEKTDVFGLYRAWLEWGLQDINESIPIYQYTVNYDFIRNKGQFFYADFVDGRSSRGALASLYEEKKKLQYKIDGLTGPDRDLFSTIVAHPRYDGYQETRSWDPDGGWTVSYTFTRRDKRYELADHRGNVMATVSDKKAGIDINSDGIIDAYEADITTATDYYPFGSLMPERKYSKEEKYRYGFNGKENDNNVKGEGNQQDYGMRIYDPRVGRFLSVDPVGSEFPWNTPYSFAENDVIRNIDLDGLEKLSPDQAAFIKKWMKWHEHNYLSTKELLDKTTDKEVRANLQKCMDQSKETYAKLVRTAYTNKLTDIEVANFYLEKGIENAKVVADLTPAGDAKVLVTGKNFQGQKQPRLAAAGWIVLDVFGGEIFSFAGKAGKNTLTVLSKGLKYANKEGKCVEFASEFVSKFEKIFKKAGAEISTYEINIGKEGLIGTSTQQLANNGTHTFVEVVKDGKSMIYDNLHPEGMLREEYIQAIAGHPKGGNVIEGQELLEKYSIKKTK